MYFIIYNPLFFYGKQPKIIQKSLIKKNKKYQYLSTRDISFCPLF